jgi:catechol 2,3-dioxygenase-like lactoylglutathione lyase family enzyme
MIENLNHVTLIVSDLEASRRFYGDALGMEEVARPESFHFAGAWFRAGSAELHLIDQKDSGQGPGETAPAEGAPGGRGRARHFACTVTSTQACLRRLTEHGIPVAVGPRPRGDGPTQTYCYDPDGHLIEFTAYD